MTPDDDPCVIKFGKAAGHDVPLAPGSEATFVARYQFSAMQPVKFVVYQTPDRFFVKSVRIGVNTQLATVDVSAQSLERRLSILDWDRVHAGQDVAITIVVSGVAEHGPATFSAAIIGEEIK